MELYEVFNIVRYYHGERDYANVIVEYDLKDKHFENESAESLITSIYTDAANDTWSEGDISVHPDPNCDYNFLDDNLHSELHNICIEISDIIVLNELPEL